MTAPSTYTSRPLSAVKAPGKYALIGGPFGSKLGRGDYVDEGIPVIRGCNLPSQSRFSFDDFVFVTDDKARDLASNLAFPGDIVVTQRGTLGQVGLIPATSPYDRFVVSQSQMKLTVDCSRANPQFVYYALVSPVGQHEIKSRAITAGVPHINLSLFQQLQIPFPPLPTQRKIAAILSAYDDLIENNTRRIEILEEMAQRIYREWFVEFRYPGHEGVPLVDSELGPIPEGWSMGLLSDLFVLQRGFDLPHQKRVNGSVPVVAATGIHGTHSIPAAQGPGVVTGRSGSLGTVLYIAGDFWPLNTTLWVKEFRAATPQVAYFMLKSIGLEHFNSGAAVPTLNRNDIAGIRLPIPPRSLVTAFSTLAEHMLRLIDIFSQSLKVLRATRDLLLPRLISGEIDVENQDIDTSGLVP